MIPFDLYRPAGTRSKTFFDGPVNAGSVVGIDAAGFSDGFFKARQTQELISFVVLPQAGGSLPADTAGFENLSFVEAEVGEHTDDTAKVTIRSIAPIGEWARRVWLTSKATFDGVPADIRPSAEILAPLREALRMKESVVWVADAAAAGAVRAVCLLKCDTDRRAIVLCASGSPSYLVRL